MVQRSSPRRERQLASFGEDLRRWRRLRGLSAAELADRAAVSRQTLRSLEAGTGGRVDSLFAVLAALGIVDNVLEAVDPFRSPAARARIDEVLRGGGSL